MYDVVQRLQIQIPSVRPLTKSPTKEETALPLGHPGEMKTLDAKAPQSWKSYDNGTISS